MKRYLALLALIGATVGTANAQVTQTQINGFDVYITGTNELGGFNPGGGNGPNGTTTELRFLDDGTDTNDTAGDGLFVTTLTNLPTNTSYSWKAAASGFTGVNIGDDQVTSTTANTEIIFYLDTDTTDDVFFPRAGDSSNYNDGWIYTSFTEDYLTSFTGEMALIGDFQDELGGADFDVSGANRAILTQNGQNWEATVTGLPAGSFGGQIITDNNFDNPRFTRSGFTLGNGFPANIPFNSAGPTDVITLTLNGITGQTRIQNSASIADGFYAQSDAWMGTGFDAITEMAETFSGSGVYFRDFTVAAAGDHTARIRQVVSGVSSSFPSTGDIPFTTTSASQSVRAIFDTNTYADGFFPDSNFALVVDTATFEPLIAFNNFQVVGSFQVDVSLFPSDNFGENPSFNLAETSAGSGIWTWSDTVLQNTNSPSDYKTAARLVPGDGFFDYQVAGGSPGDTITVTGNNANISGLTYGASDTLFATVDLLWGRMLMSNAAITPPNRPAYLGGTNVDNWSAFD